MMSHPRTRILSRLRFGGVIEVGEGQLIGPEVSMFLLKSVTLERCGTALGRRLSEELNGVHDTFHVSNLKKCLADPTLQVPLDEIQFDAKLNFVE
ncbi:hypothetical protein Tco_0532704 [Tanacetum coccineum]